jgi:hypothetical protein
MMQLEAALAACSLRIAEFEHKYEVEEAARAGAEDAATLELVALRGKYEVSGTEMCVSMC